MAGLLPLASCATDGRAEPGDDFTRFVSWWAGDYSNDAQVRAQAEARVPAESRNAHLTLHVRRVDLPAFGSEVFYAEWNSQPAGAAPVRQRLYAFELGATPGTFVLRLHIWPRDNPAFVTRTDGAYLDPARLSGVTPRDMAVMPGCDVTFRLDGNAFSGTMDRGACQFPSFEDPTVKIYSWSQMSVTAEEFRYKDGWFHLDGRPYQEFGADWYRFRRMTSGASADASKIRSPRARVVL